MVDKDKRRYHRMNVAIPMSFRVPPKEKIVSTATLDISGTGVAFVTTEALKARQELLLYLQLAPGEKVEIHAQVVHVVPEANPAGRSQYRVSVKIVDPIKFDERRFVKFYSDKLIEFFGKGPRAS